ncbi:MAG: NADH-quinone oxidoreductase subunit J, partial [Pseudomonadota bacterium]|nr:NADH-quinone oxidoreductase subunit J [Pseudomonadota bacterium]
MVVFSKNPINSVLFLIFSFINTAGIFLIAGAEFLALILVIVYVGAVAVLFLFVIMMLDLDVNQIKGEIKKYYKVGIPIGLIILIEMGLIIFLNPFKDESAFLNKEQVNSDLSNTERI